VPWTILSSKVGGSSVGFIVSDSRGVKFLLKFDRLGHPETETATEVIVSHILWAAGYNVAEDHIVYFRPSDLVVAPDAKLKDWSGTLGKLDREELERQLALVVKEPDGRIRGMASLMLEGKALGGHAAEGVREDDPNDRIPHERRRDLRGLYALFAWLDNIDVKEDNTLDMWAKDPADPARRYVMHYLIDFGSALGAAAEFQADPRVSHEYGLDFPAVFREIATLGLAPKVWQGRRVPGLVGVGLFEAERYDPGTWLPETPAYLPIRVADRRDNYWASKILIRFTRAQLRAIVETARLSDPRAAEYIVDTLVARQRATARYWFERVPPLDHFTVTGTGALCFDDLLLAYELAPRRSTRYRATVRDRDGRVLAVREADPQPGGRACTGPIPLAAGGEGYTIVELASSRMPATGTFVHLARDPATRAPRVIGVWRP
jgi:hypothetical protein